MLPVYTATIFVSALLLFLIQPMFARMALPYLGGTPAVWNTAQVFFQAALLAGYGFAHATTGKLGARRQAGLQFVLLLIPLLVLPIAMPRGWTPPTASNPIPWLLSLLLVAVGLPFFAVSTSSPVLQKWFAATGHHRAGDPYFLYAASNLGSMLALLGYPLFIEPNFTLGMQSRLWMGGYIVLIVLTVSSGILLWKATDVETRFIASPSEAPLAETRSIESLPAARRARWLLLAFVPSSLMLSVTTYISTDIAAIPMLWVIPLSLYLLSFIAVFARRPAPHRLLARMAPVLLVLLAVVLATETQQPMQMLMLLHLGTFFIVALICHGEIARDRPPAAQLTEFYLWMAFGGVLGGIFNALLAPVLFKTVAEYPITLVLACLALPRPAQIDKPLQRILDFALPAGMGVLAALLVYGLRHAQGHLISFNKINPFTFWTLALICLCFMMRPLRFGLGLGVILFTSVLCANADQSLLFSARSFFAVHRVVYVDDPKTQYHEFIHGNILHGIQSFAPGRLHTPLSYYYLEGPVGQMFRSFSGAQAKKSIAIVGLGTGALTCYSQPGQHWTYYEIDPMVERIARDPALFTFLRDCPAQCDVVLGDARLSLQNVPDASHDLIILDAYSSDAIPVHLITREALQLYLRKLSPHGVIVYHISNLHLALEPVVAGLAHDAGLAARVQTKLLPAEDHPERSSSSWVVLARRESDLGALATSADWVPPKERPGMRVWTDDYSSILSVFKW